MMPVFLRLERKNVNKKKIYNYTKKNYFTITSDEKNVCPECNQIMRVRDSRKRTVMDECGEKYVFNLRRFKCEECQNIHLELPDCLVPYKRYSKNAIDVVVNGKCDYYIVDQSTIYRWTHPLCNDRDISD